MEPSYRQVLHRINCLDNDRQSLYHQAARKLGVADSVLIVLYMLYEKGSGCLLCQLRGESGVSKQTINSAIRKLEEEGSLYLQRDTGLRKRVFLTPAGERRVERTAARLLEAECNAFRAWSDRELADYVRLMERYNQAFRQEIQRLEPESPPALPPEEG